MTRQGPYTTDASHTRHARTSREIHVGITAIERGEVIPLPAHAQTCEW